MGISVPSLGFVNLAPVLDGMVVGCIVVLVHKAVETFDAEFLFDISGVVGDVVRRLNSQQSPQPWSQTLQTGDLLGADGSALGLVKAGMVDYLRTSILPCLERLS